MTDTGKIRQQLTGLSREGCLTVAARAALQIMPLMMLEFGDERTAEQVANAGFDVWRDAERSQYLLALSVIYGKQRTTAGWLCTHLNLPVLLRNKRSIAAKTSQNHGLLKLLIK